MSYAIGRLRQRLRDRERKINQEPIRRDNQISNIGTSAGHERRRIRRDSQISSTGTSAGNAADATEFAVRMAITPFVY
jgi:hypothetical protein